jgi:hypothetical protein
MYLRKEAVLDHKLPDVPRRRRSVHEVTRLEFCRDIRNDDGHARREIEEIVRRFGRMYENQLRGWSCVAPALVGIHDEADKEGLVALGTMRLHHARRIVSGSPLDDRMIMIESGGAAAR